MKFLTLLSVLLLTACSTHIVDMTEQPTVQKYDLTDTEGDGIILARDECPDTYSGALVNNQGCGTQTVETVRRKLEVNFDTNSYEVKAQYFPEIEQLAQFMQEFPQAIVTIEGHTSIRGKASLNKRLSQNRANAIKEILTQKYGIDSARITAVGYGFDKLLLEGDDEYIHARNRRIVAEISSDKNLIDMKWTIYSVDNEVE
ncbi:OmpA family protein [Psychromonas sp. psych-6C06]|uniref:OmpA family protein n=1 Tax=Psychromonas sp. psych-6C06 TaxID=2058089 RepID=UPI001EE72BB0|nr:OmpA family protein [Psychromonas sp. psych-6C06]